MKKKTTKKEHIAPLGDRVLVRPDVADEKSQKNKFGILLPEASDKEKSEQGVVVAVGPGRYTDDGKLVAPKVKVGDRVAFSKYSFDEIKDGEVEYVLVREENILAILN